jgi:hypothetical protein
VCCKEFTRARDWRKKKWEYNETVQQLFMDFKKAYDSVTREILHSILRVLSIHGISHPD